MVFKVQDRAIRLVGIAPIVGDNPKYTAQFDFDATWDGQTKTAIFKQNGIKYPVLLDDQNTCIIPPLKKGVVEVGVMSADYTTVPASLKVVASINQDGAPGDIETDVYVQVLQKLDDLKEYLQQNVAEAVTRYLQENPIEDYLTEEEVKNIIADYMSENPVDSITPEEIGSIVSDWVSSHVSELKGDKGDPFTYSDFTPEQLKALKGDKGDPFTYSDFTPEQLKALKGDKGDPFTYSDFTPEQLEALKGDKGDPFTYSDFTPEQLEALKGSGRQVAYAGEETADTLIKLTEEEGIPIDLSEVIVDKSLKFIESNDFRLVNSLQAIIADIDNFNKVMYMGNYPYINKYDISTDSPTLVKSIFYENFGFASTATNNGRVMSFLARNCVIIGDYIYYAVRNSSGQNMDLSENACNGGIVILQKSDFTVVGHLALPHLVTWVTKYSRNGIDYIFANLRTEGFKLYEVTTNPLVPTLVYDGSLPHDSAATNEHQAGYIVNLPSGKTLYVAMGFANAIFFYDIDDLSNIVLLKKITVGTASNRDVNVGHTYSAYVNYPYMYCTAASSLSLVYKTSGLFRLDISDIENGNVGIKMHLVDESLSSQISAGDMQPSYVERWGNHLLVPANEKGIYVYRFLDDGDIEYEGTWVIDSKRVKSEGYDTKPCKIFHCKSDYLGRLFVPESDIMNQSDVSVMQNGREPYRRCHIYKLINRIV